VITDLAAFDFEGGEMRLASLYPGVSADDVEERMGFSPRRAPELAELEPPSEEETARLQELTLPALPY
jgi:acyl CoA:acetate/3-ketoacid CoA transferase beta subunit